MFAKHQAGLGHTKFGFYQFQSFLFIVVIVISILLKTTFSHISIHSQLQLITGENFIAIGRGKDIFKAIEKYRYGSEKLYRNILNGRFSVRNPKSENSHAQIRAIKEHWNFS